MTDVTDFRASRFVEIELDAAIKHERLRKRVNHLYLLTALNAVSIIIVALAVLVRALP